MKISKTTGKPCIYSVPVSDVYPYYIVKVVKKGRTQPEVNKIFSWLTGYTPAKLKTELKKGTNFEDFFKKAPKMNPKRTLITGKICGVQIEEIKEKTMKEIRYLDKLIDELAKGKELEKILRK